MLDKKEYRDGLESLLQALDDLERRVVREGVTVQGVLTITTLSDEDLERRCTSDTARTLGGVLKDLLVYVMATTEETDSVPVLFGRMRNVVRGLLLQEEVCNG